ncbi:tetratricopeptide repeat protein [Nonomuraea gerenzanensis]|uniref:WD40-repeat containing protein n=1 Tax=Nonomuraea gerenzanensis TaxID=93944 RepID=A0A1M4DVV2_9ACTN|nr:ATP-binding protein [Nonomuraea gerenzanensis]UBU13043.1 ATP-binding protein [Nonomuraea gerenzanensis]SBO90685.1 WD40-repeat containing protein [Nonomuraea gerenzanensis]
MAGIPAALRRRRSPFIGPRPFTAHDESLFFGRSDETRVLLELWRRNRLTILHSDAAAGKTSLLRAGLIPALRADDANVLPLGRATSCQVWPAPALPGSNPYVLTLLSSWDPEESPGRLAALSISEFVRGRQTHGGDGRPAPLFAAVDQAETFLRRPERDRGHRRRLLDELFQALVSRPDLRLLLAVRSDYLDDLRHVVKDADSPECVEYHLGPLTPEAAAVVVSRSAQAMRLHFPAAEVEELLEELRTIRDESGRATRLTRAIDPLLLQVAGAHLWRDPPGQDHSGSPRLRGEVDQALAGWCGRTLAAAAAEHELPPRELDGWLRRTLLHRGTSGPAPAAKLSDAFLHSLEDRHLITDARHNAGPDLRQRRLLDPLRRLDPGQWPQPPPDPAALLCAAVRARAEGEPGRAARLAHEAARVCPAKEMRVRADIETLLGNLCHERRAPDEAVARYLAAATLFEALNDCTSVGWMLAAIGRISLGQGRRSTAIDHMVAAVSRLPNDPVVRTGLGQALRAAGETMAALDVLSRVLERDNVPEARWTWNELAREQGAGGPPA